MLIKQYLTVLSGPKHLFLVLLQNLHKPVIGPHASSDTLHQSIGFLERHSHLVHEVRDHYGGSPGHSSIAVDKDAPLLAAIVDEFETAFEEHGDVGGGIVKDFHVFVDELRFVIVRDSVGNVQNVGDVEIVQDFEFGGNVLRA